MSIVFVLVIFVVADSFVLVPSVGAKSVYVKRLVRGVDVQVFDDVSKNALYKTVIKHEPKTYVCIGVCDGR